MIEEHNADTIMHLKQLAAQGCFAEMKSEWSEDQSDLLPNNKSECLSLNLHESYHNFSGCKHWLYHSNHIVTEKQSLSWSN